MDSNTARSFSRAVEGRPPARREIPGHDVAMQVGRDPLVQGRPSASPVSGPCTVIRS
ncbi:hypothetical protein [Streptomyces microflavus]|uniref:hypothetical protein n=1 Tax=Streptomyces microflavus TaxID=1919 RepID=UPI0003A96F74|nr:hypothetical protein [Streptomyces microflavus]